MFAIAVNALFTNLRRRGTTRQLAGAIVICVISALLLLPALAWYNLRFSAEQGQLMTLEIELALVYVALWGWGVPLGVTVIYCLFTLPRDTTTAMHIPRQKSSIGIAPKPPRHQPGVLSPLVFDEETPWGWLEYRNGNFQGQRLALKREVATLGRDEDSDIWIDDDMASRHHAELAYDQGKVYLTDCGSLNGVLLNQKRMRGTMIVEANALLQIGEQCFSFILAEPGNSIAEQNDPLAHHTLRSSLHGLKRDDERSPEPGASDETAKIAYKIPQLPPTNPGGALIIQNGEMAGQSFLLDRAVISVGRGQESDIVINDTSISRRHVQFLRQLDGDYAQDLGSSNGTQVNSEPLRMPMLLRIGDIILLGNIRLEYTARPAVRTVPASRVTTPQSSSGLISGPTPLKLPSKQK